MVMDAGYWIGLGSDLGLVGQEGWRLRREFGDDREGGGSRKVEKGSKEEECRDGGGDGLGLGMGPTCSDG